jgi:uncharacterized protein (UPF0261 family)
LYDPQKDRVFVEELIRHLKPEIEIVELDYNLEDPPFALALVEKLDSLCKGTGEASRV